MRRQERIMSLKELGISHKTLDEMLIASIRFQLHKRAELKTKFEQLFQHCKGDICGPSFIVYHWGTGIKPFDIEAGVPVTQTVETDEINSRILEGGDALTILHYGSLDTAKKSLGTLNEYMESHGIISAPSAREVYLETNLETPDKNVTEIQVMLLGWEQRFVKHVECVLGTEAKESIVQGVENLSPESSIKERVTWLKAAINRLSDLADDEQKYQILSNCGHIFSQDRIMKLKAIYELNKDIDEVLEAMREDPEWYETPVREGNIIYVGKNPYNSEGYKAAKTAAEKKKFYCHCSMIRDHMDEISPTFCNCGAGWYRQQWEGILEKQVRVEILKSLVKGDDECYFAIHLPS